MRTRGQSRLLNKYHVSSKIFKNYCDEINGLYKQEGKNSSPALNYIHPEFKENLE